MILNWKLIIKKSKALMEKQTKLNKSPPLQLTKIAIEKGKDLSKSHKVDKNLVIVSLYLAHTIFNQQKSSKIRKEHPKLSSNFVKPYLNEWKIPIKEQKIILNSIEAHHGSIKTETKIAEVVKNAECFKFVTIEGSLIYFHELGKRGTNYKEAKKLVLEKANEKYKLLTFKECIKDVEEQMKVINHIFK
ncbi:hypothetical protein GW835_01770 [archaeon]|nr:hypothetical protein [archaeon]NCP79277.1 hypothetical protein [archaeon]NCP98264.1 hypothetical protein [archaeon]NCQ07044.1 hypothetical protein [archaeon]NCQ50840.1 hypothetical protein [archaeon]